MVFARGRSNQCDRFADIAYLVISQERLRDEGEGISGLGIGLNVGQERLQSIGTGIGRYQHRQDARHRFRRRRVYPIDFGVRVGRAQHNRMRQAIEGEVVEIAALPGQEPQILAPFGRVADA